RARRGGRAGPGRTGAGRGLPGAVPGSVGTAAAQRRPHARGGGGRPRARPGDLPAAAAGPVGGGRDRRCARGLAAARSRGAAVVSSWGLILVLAVATYGLRLAGTQTSERLQRSAAGVDLVGYLAPAVLGG